MNNIQLNDGLIIPQIGIGTYKVTNQRDIDKLVNTAFDNNYSMLDTASYYNNEKLIGNTFKNSPILKNHFKVSTKIWPVNYNADGAKYSIERSLTDMNLDIIDIMFLHWPSEGFLESWKVLENYYEQGLIKSIAICNFNQEHIEKLLLNANIKPSINQVELHPYLIQKELRDYCNKMDIKIQAWSPLGRGDEKLFNEKVILTLAEKYNKSTAQIILRWHIENGEIIIPKSSNENRIKENINIFDFKLESDEINSISNLNKNFRYSQDPEDKQWLNKIRNGLN